MKADETAKKMFKVTVLYGHPANPAEFERYYASTHLPLAARMRGLARLELTQFTSAPDGSLPVFYRMAELLFASQPQMAETMDSPEGKATVADLANFATGGVTVLIGTVDS